MKTQRGLGLVEIMIFMVIAGVFMAGVYAAWASFKNSIAEPYVQAQIKKDQATIDGFKSNAAKADAERDNANVDRDKAQAAAKEQSEKLAAAQKLEDEARKAAREAAIKYAALLAANDKRYRSLQSIAGAVAEKGRTCDQVLSATDTILRDSAKARAVVPK